MKTNIFKGNLPFKPFTYQKYSDAWMSQHFAHWLHTEIPMAQDVIDYNEALNEDERFVINSILNNFAQTECEVGNYWSSKVPEWLPHHEVKKMAISFADMETIHAMAYSHLNDTLGIDNFDQFLDDEVVMKKLGTLMSVNNDVNWAKRLKDLPDDIPGAIEMKKWAEETYDELEWRSTIAISIAVFAVTEGMHLFSNFATLFSFKRLGLLSGVAQQMELSIRDESLHSRMGTDIFRQIVDENPEMWTSSFRRKLYESVDLCLKNELEYIGQIFEGRELRSINEVDLKQFMFERANRKLVEMGLSPTYSHDEDILDPERMGWFYSMSSGASQTDFFNQRETQYGKVNKSWSDGSFFDCID